MEAMPPIPEPEPAIRTMIDTHQQGLLLEIARASIRHGLDSGRPLTVDPAGYESPLGEPAATFVTLNLNGGLRGCIGQLEARRPLVTDVAENAFSAAFRDPRFPPLAEPEWPALDIHISILTPAQAIAASCEEELLDALQPGLDGLIIEEGRRRATFLPSVWESLPDRREFLRQLRLKAGLAPDHWSSGFRAYRYRTFSFPS